MRHAARSTGLTAADTRAAEAVLGREPSTHPRASRTCTRLRSSRLVATLASSRVPSPFSARIRHVRARLRRRRRRCVGVRHRWFAADRVARERAEDLIAAGNDSVALPVSLATDGASHLERSARRLAHSLEVLHRDALRWYEIRPAVPTATRRRSSSDTWAREVEALDDRPAPRPRRVQGVALTVAISSRDGHASPLYGNELGPLREELNRIRYLLEHDARPRGESRPGRRAA